MAKKAVQKKSMRKTATVKPPKSGSRLTEEEIAVLTWCSKGLSKAQTGQRLGISEGYVKFFMARIFRRLGAKTAAHAVARAYQQRIFKIQ